MITHEGKSLERHTLQESEQAHMEQEIKQAFERLSEIDAHGFSSMTMPVKEYIERSLDASGKLNPLRSSELTRRVNKLYYGEYAERLERRNQNDKGENLNKIFFRIPFAGKGFQGMNFMEYDRRDARTWRTSEFGIGYTTTAREKPEWLMIHIDHPWEIVDRNDYYQEVWSVTRQAQGTVNSAPAIIRWIARQHENGACESYEFTFETEQEADRFASFLSDKERTSLTPDEKLRWMWKSGREGINWDQLSFIDSRFLFLDPAFVRSKRGKEFLRRNDIRERDFREAVAVYTKNVWERCKRLTDMAVEEAKQQKKPEDFGSPVDYMRYLDDVRRDALHWDMLEPLLEDCESRIISLVKTMSHW